jgi:hypothetical protein
MSTAVISATEVLASQQAIRMNQSFILKNQEEIKKNQETGSVIVKNQERFWLPCAARDGLEHQFG